MFSRDHVEPLFALRNSVPRKKRWKVFRIPRNMPYTTRKKHALCKKPDAMLQGASCKQSAVPVQFLSPRTHKSAKRHTHTHTQNPISHSLTRFKGSLLITSVAAFQVHYSWPHWYVSFSFCPALKRGLPQNKPFGFKLACTVIRNNIMPRHMERGKKCESLGCYIYKPACTNPLSFRIISAWVAISNI